MDPADFSSILKALRLIEYGGNLNSAGEEIETLRVILEQATTYLFQPNITHNQPSTPLADENRKRSDEIRRIELALDRVRMVVKKRARGVLQIRTTSIGASVELSLARERRRKISCLEPRSRMLALLALKHIENVITCSQLDAGASGSRNDLKIDLNVRLSRHESQSTIASYITVPSEPEVVGRSEAGFTKLETHWQKCLEAEGLLLPPLEQIHWSKNGQHAEFADATEVPLIPEKVLCQTKSSSVDSVKCRRIRLARKSIRCPRHQKMEELLTEVKHLNRLHHPHIVQLVGTYILGNTLAILLYPVAEYTLDTYMKKCYSGEDESKEMLLVLEKFPRCLAMTVKYIHSTNTIHMDIKPQNVLVRKRRNSEEKYRVYIADFGISRLYADTADTETDGQTPFTKRYCAPEAASRERRGMSADIYSLGCVFAEIFTTLAGKTLEEFTEARKDKLDATLEEDTTFHNNRDRVLAWMASLSWSHYDSTKMRNYQTRVPSLIVDMLQGDPGARVGLEAVEESLSILSDTAHVCCSEPPEHYECVE
ncbi:hypothetical protein GP486_000598 [Trichoglossum hirsutum]|uniref:Protein kinase domain-containing protein n=1 Tax=Trichoglossum hirsutum TaxID=265104 RepID=A0A9P8LIL6_9PEZI|nr:hypothetical protein GP486_000598 [Trichoglossum hirsutum]